MISFFAYVLYFLVSGRTSPLRSMNAVDEGAVRRTLARAAIAAAMMQPKETNFSFSKFPRNNFPVSLFRKEDVRSMLTGIA